MASSFSRVCLIFALFAVASPLSAIAPSLSAEQARQFMASRDLQLNNVMVEYTKTGAEFVDAANLDFLGSPTDFPGEIPFSHRERMVIRNHEFTTFSDAIPEFKGELESGHRLTPHTRWTNRGTHVVEVLGQDGDATSIVTHLPEAHSFGGSNRFLWPIEFSLGVGFGRRTESITFQKQDQEAISAKCILSLSADEKADCEFTMDSDYIVRSATIRTGNDKRWYVYKIETAGLLEAADYRCAKTGEFAASTFTRQDDGSVVESPNRRYSVTDVNIKTNLSDAEYEALTVVELPEKRQVDDPHGLLTTPEREKVNPFVIIILGNLVIIAVVCFFLLKRRISRT